MLSIQDIIKAKQSIKEEVLDKHKYISQEFQDYGYRLASKLGTLSEVSMYIKLAKNKPRALLEQAFSFAIDYPNATNKGKIFMWKLKELEQERFERLRKKNSALHVILLSLDTLLKNPSVSFLDKYQSQFLLDPIDFELFLKEDYSKCLLGKRDLKKVLKKYLKTWKWQGSVDELVNYWFNEPLYINLDVMDTLSKLNSDKYKIYLYGDYDKYQSDYIEQSVKNVVTIDGFYFSSRTGMIKKSIKSFRRIISDLLVEPSQIHCIDTDLKSLKTAKKVGINIYQYPTVGIDEIIKNVSTKP